MSRVAVAVVMRDGIDWKGNIVRGERVIGTAETRGDRVLFTIDKPADEAALRRQAIAAGAASVQCHLDDLSEAAND